MNKVVCYVCGTSYPESATQCPICGYVQTAETAVSDNGGDKGYTYVKGGRFSKANVKKRNQTSAKKPQVSENSKKKKPSGDAKKPKVTSIVLIVVLFLAIISVASYILLRFFLPNDFLFEGFGDLTVVHNQETEPSEVEATVEPTVAETIETTEATVPLDCTAIVLAEEFLQFDEIGTSFQLAVTLEPADTLDPVSYATSDESVATVNNEGLITTVGNGTAVITVTCGSVSAECTVNCSAVADDEAFELNRKEITFDAEGQTWTLYSGEIAVEDIIWSSDDNNVATIENGKVTAVANGDTTVFATYNDQTVACVIHCKFEDKQDETSNITEADGSSTTYMLHNPYGYADDVTLNVGDQFTLKLVDSNMENAENVQWSVKNESVCQFSDNIVTATGSGVTEVTATCEGKTYTCVVRVN